VRLPDKILLIITLITYGYVISLIFKADNTPTETICLFIFVTVMFLSFAPRPNLGDD
jgi:ABC-type iron transport system FetAB permease component